MNEIVLAQRRAEKEKQAETKRLVHPLFVRECLEAEDLGDATLYKIINRDDVRFNATSGKWMAYTGTRWKEDILGIAEILVEKVADIYLEERSNVLKEIEELEAAGEQAKPYLKSIPKKIVRRVKKLRSVTGRRNCLEFAHTSRWIAGPPDMAVVGEMFDRHPYLFPCSNLVIDLKDGIAHPGCREDYLFRGSPVEWRGLDAPRPYWDRVVHQAMCGDGEKISFLQRLFGMALVREVVDHAFFVFWGSGANGKSLIVNTIMQALGELAAPLPVEMFLAQRGVRNSAAPSPDVLAVLGLALAVLSEPDPGVQVSPGRIKWMTGGDSLSGRNPHDKFATTFVPACAFVMLTNDRPGAPGQDRAFWRRVHLVEFKASFVENPQGPNQYLVDKSLPQKLKAELPGVLAWLVEGCLLWQRDGLSPPAEVVAATRAYQADEDVLAAFLDDCCEIGEVFSEKATALFDGFTEWFVENYGKKFPSQKTFGSWMVRQFERSKSKPRVYYGLRLLKEGD